MMEAALEPPIRCESLLRRAALAYVELLHPSVAVPLAKTYALVRIKRLPGAVQPLERTPATALAMLEQARFDLTAAGTDAVLLGGSIAAWLEAGRVARGTRDRGVGGDTAAPCYGGWRC